MSAISHIGGRQLFMKSHMKASSESETEIKITNVITNRTKNSKAIWKQDINSFKILHFISIVFEKGQIRTQSQYTWIHTQTYSYIFICEFMHAIIYICLHIWLYAPTGVKGEMKIALQCGDECVCVCVCASTRKLFICAQMNDETLGKITG